MRFCLDAVHANDAPLTSRPVVEGAMRTKGPDTADRPLRRVVTGQVRMAFYRLSSKGFIFRIGGKRCVWGNMPAAE